MEGFINASVKRQDEQLVITWEGEGLGNVAVKQMLQEGLVLMERHGALVLSDAGERRARAHAERLDFFHGLLTKSGVEDEAARIEADAITRALSGRSFEALRRYLGSRGVETPSVEAE